VGNVCSFAVPGTRPGGFGLGTTDLSVVLQLSFPLGVVPPEFAGEQFGNCRCGCERGRAIEEMSSRAPHEDIVERGHHLVARGVHRFGSQVGLALDEGIGEVGLEGDEGPDLVGGRAVPAVEMGANGSSPVTRSRAGPEECESFRR
jgi:hypothetical protein